MRNSSHKPAYLGRRWEGVAWLLGILGVTTLGRAQVAAAGYASERLNPGPPGNAWIVFDELKLHGPLGGGIALTSGYSRNPVHPSLNGERVLNTVSHQAFVDVGLAILVDRFRFTLNLPSPLYVMGQSGTVGGTLFAAPSVDSGKRPDVISDARFGVDTRLWGSVEGPLRLGFSAQLFIPSGERANYVTDNTFRSLLRGQFAGDFGRFYHAGYAGIHLRPRDDSDVLSSPSLGGPRGSEFVFGLALAPEITIGDARLDRLRVGPEIFGQSALNRAFGKYTTALEALLSANYTHETAQGAAFRAKLGLGNGVISEFGAPAWRAVLALEISDRFRR